MALHWVGLDLAFSEGYGRLAVLHKSGVFFFRKIAKVTVLYVQGSSSFYELSNDTRRVYYSPPNSSI